GRCAWRSRIAASAVAVAASWGPVVDCHPAVLEVPFDEKRRGDAQREHHRLLPGGLRPPRADRWAAEVGARPDRGSGPPEITLTTVGPAHHAVQRISRVAVQVAGFLRPGHGAHEELPIHEVRLDRADPGRTIRAYRAQHRYRHGAQPGQAKAGNLGRALFHLAP